MSRRLRRCLTCEPQEPTPERRFSAIRGYTRHDNRVCAACRRKGHYVRGGVLHLTLTVDYGDSEARRSDHYAGRGGW